MSNVPVPGATSMGGAHDGHVMIDLGDDEFTRGRPHPMFEPSVRDAPLAEALADPAVGLILLGFPGVWGNGYEMTNDILHQKFLVDEFPLLFILGLFFAKLLATSAAVGSGAVGGVITPTLFLGAALGSILSVLLALIGQESQLPGSVFALVGMGSILLDNVRVGEECVIGAGSLLTAGMVVPPRSLVFGRPAKVVRPVTEEESRLGLEGARRYLGYVREYRYPPPPK